MSDRILIPIRADLVERLEDLVARGDYSALDAMVDRALEGDPATWREPEPRVEHNHVTRDIKPLGVCPACDKYIHAFSKRPSALIFCSCCPKGCLQAFSWRGIARCGCSPQAQRARVVQPNLQR